MLAALLCAWGAQGQPHENLNAVLWVCNAAEYAAIARQSYAAARRSARSGRNGLDNGAYQAALILRAIPGARRVLAAAREAGVAVFYVTNRSCTSDAADPTARVLRRLMVPLEPGALLCGHS